MGMPTNITDQRTGETAKVILGNALAVGPPSPSDTFNATLDLDDVPVEIVSGEAGQGFCLTGIILTGNKNIDQNVDAIVTLYQATADDLDTSLKDILVVPVSRSGQISLTGIYLEVPQGHFIMAETTDDDVFVTVFGWYME